MLRNSGGCRTIFLRCRATITTGTDVSVHVRHTTFHRSHTIADTLSQGILQILPEVIATAESTDVNKYRCSSAVGNFHNAHGGESFHLLTAGHRQTGSRK